MQAFLKINEHAEKMSERLKASRPDVYGHQILMKSRTFTSAPLAQKFTISVCKTKLLLCCTKLSFQLSTQPVFSGALLQIPTQLRHTLEHNPPPPPPPAKNNPMRGDTHSGKQSERHTVHQLEKMANGGSDCVFNLLADENREGAKTRFPLPTSPDCDGGHGG